MTQALDDGPFFHGTEAAMQSDELLATGFRSNYRPEIIMNHIYFTALVGGPSRPHSGATTRIPAVAAARARSSS